MNGRYDAVYSLGQWCATALYLKKFGLRSCSGPFDWMGYTVPLSTYFDLIIRGFDGFPDVEALEFVRDCPAEGKRVYRETRTGFVYPHDFRIGGDFAGECRVLREKSGRRASRFLAELAEKKVLLVHWHGEGQYDRGEVRDGLSALRRHFNNGRIDLLVLENGGDGKRVEFHTVDGGPVFCTGEFYRQGSYDAVLGNRRACEQAFSPIRMRNRFGNLVHNRVESFRKRLRRWFSR